MLSAQQLKPPTEIEELANRIHGRMAGTGISPEVKIWADRQLEAIQSDLDQIQRGTDGYHDFLAAFVSREHERLSHDADDDHPYESLRTEPLCTCRDFGCPLKKGTLPSAVRDADDLDAAIREFVLEHSGDPLVLDHEDEPPGARQAWSAKRARVWSVLRTLEAFTGDGRDDAPTAEELAGSKHVDPLPDGAEAYAADEAVMGE